MQISFDLLIGSAISLVAAFLWAIAINVYKSQSKEATPLAITAMKMWLSLVVMAVLVIVPFRVTPFYMPPDSIVYLASSVTIGLVFGDIAYLTSQERIGVSYAYPIATTYPIVTYIIAIFIVGEEILVTRFLGIILAVAGVMLISREQAVSNNRNRLKTFDKVGIVLAIITILCWSVGSVLLQLGVENVDPIDANFVRMLFGSGIIVPIFLGAIHNGMSKPTRRATKIILAAAFFGMAIGSLLYTYAVKLVGATIAAVLGSVSPLFALPISILFLKEDYSNKSILGVVLTVVGVVLVVLAV